MTTTPHSLLERLCRPPEATAAADWEAFVELFTPLLCDWARQLTRSANPADLVQDVFLRLLRQLPRFRQNGQGSFRGWLYTVLRNCWRDRCRRHSAQPLVNETAVADPAPGPAETIAAADFREQLMRRALQISQRDFQPTTWQAFWETVVEGRPADVVAAELGLRADAVYAAVARVRRRLHQELKDFLD